MGMLSYLGSSGVGGRSSSPGSSVLEVVSCRVYLAYKLTEVNLVGGQCACMQLLYGSSGYFK